MSVFVWHKKERTISVNDVQVQPRRTTISDFVALLCQKYVYITPYRHGTDTTVSYMTVVVGFRTKEKITCFKLVWVVPPLGIPGGTGRGSDMNDDDFFRFILYP